MFKTVYLDCNKTNSNIKNEDNSQWTTELKQELYLPPGTQISLQNSFINQKGVTGQSIELENDIDEEINYFYYSVEGPDIVPRIEESATSYPFQHAFFEINLSDLTNAAPVDMINRLSNVAVNGRSEEPLILYDFNTVSKTISPKIGTSRVKIPRGIYGISQIADIITNNINNNQDGLVPKNEIEQQFKSKEFDETFISKNNNSTLVRIDVVDTINSATITDPAGGNLFIQPSLHKTIIDDVKNNNDSSNIPVWTGNLSNSKYARTPRKTFTTGVLHGDDSQYRVFSYGRFIGADNLNISFNSEKSAFEISNLHTDYRFPSIDQYYNLQELKGKIGFHLRKLNGQALTDIGEALASNADKIRKFKSALQKPLSRRGGIIVHNWGYKTAISESKFDNTVSNNASKFMTFKDFFKTTDEAKKAWSKTLWSRLGFSYEQLNDSSYFEDISFYDQPTSTNLGGSTTNNLPDKTIIQDISAQINNSHIVSSKQATTSINSGDVEVFDLFDSALILSDPSGSRGPDGNNAVNIGSYNGSFLSQCTMLAVESEPQSITAISLPTLSTRGYYLITSDIIDEYSDIVKSGSPLSLLGVVPKSSLSNQDFIATQSEITQTVSQAKNINSIKIKVLNPDLTNPSLDPNSSVILKLDIPIPQIRPAQKK